MTRRWRRAKRCPRCGQGARLITPKSDPRATPMCLHCCIEADWNSPEEMERHQAVVDQIVADIAEPVRIEKLGWEARRWLDDREEP